MSEEVLDKTTNAVIHSFSFCVTLNAGNMENKNADNGEALNPVENDIGIEKNDSLDSIIKNILFTDEQEDAQPEALSQEGEVQTEDKGTESEAQTDGFEQYDENTPQAEDGEAVHSQEEDKAEPNEQEFSGFKKRIDKLTDSAQASGGECRETD